MVTWRDAQIAVLGIREIPERVDRLCWITISDICKSWWNPDIHALYELGHSEKAKPHDPSRALYRCLLSGEHSFPGAGQLVIAGTPLLGDGWFERALQHVCVVT